MLIEARRTGSAGRNAFLAPDSATARHLAEARRYLPGGTSRLHYHFSPYPIVARAGRGSRLTDIEDVERIDCLNNMTALIHGHADPVTTAAIIEQLQRGSAFSEPAEQELALARLLVERVPSVEQVHFRSSGTEAVMMAVKLARAFTGRSRIAKFEGFYHGYYDYVQVSFSSTPATWGEPDTPASVPSSGGLAAGLEDDVLVLPFNDQDGVERLLEHHGGSLAALLVEPLSNRAGMPVPQPGFYDFLREITRTYGILLIFDEVISFRVGLAGAQGRYGGKPDLTAFGKIIGGGLPVGAVGGRRDVMSLLDPTNGPAKVISGGTYSGNPLTMVAGQAAMEQLTPAAFARLEALGTRLRAGGDAIFRAAGIPAHVTGDGSLFEIVLTDRPIVNYRSMPRDPAATEQIHQLHLNLLDEGVIVSSRGLGCLSTPMNEAEVDAVLLALECAVGRLPRQ
ncbi:MAG: aspartate aminotransferase family protein [Chloroflexi bacterium]|nr:aspartate aminotransferase family protein [Chloroflexota bacterium]